MRQRVEELLVDVRARRWDARQKGLAWEILVFRLLEEVLVWALDSEVL
jgi:hypothetical protein